MPFDKYLNPKLNIKPDISVLAPLDFDEKIPKILHQTYSTRQIPQPLSDNISKIKKLNPDWEYRFYDDTDIVRFIKENYDSKILKIFLRINPKYGAARADLFRYLLMYVCGGVYLDIKGSLAKPLNSVIRTDDEFLLSRWHDKNDEQHKGWGVHDEPDHERFEEFQQWYIVAAPGHPFLKAVIQNVLRNIETYNPAFHGVGKPGVLRVTGPVAYTLAIQPILKLHPHRFVFSKSELGFEYSIFKSSDGHNNMFKVHYSDLQESVVKLGCIKRLEVSVLNSLKKIKAALLS